MAVFLIGWVFLGHPVDEHSYVLKSHKIMVGRARLTTNRVGVA